MEVSLEQLTAFTLARQGLLNPFSQSGVKDVVEKIGALHAQIPTTCPVQLWTRMKNLKEEDYWTTSLNDRTIVRTWVMRCTVHIVPSKNLEMFLSAIGPEWTNLWSRVKRETEKNLTQEDLRKARRAIKAAFKKRPMTRKELKVALNNKSVDKVVSVIGWEATLRHLVYWGDIVHGETRGRESVLHATQEWIGRELRMYESDKTCEALLDTYLRTLGPASPQDFAHWTGLRAQTCNNAFNKLSERLVEIRTHNTKKSLYLRRIDLRELEKAEISASHLKMISKFDPILLGHKDRSRLLDKKHHHKIFGLLADVNAAILLGGRVAGIWAHKRQGKTLRIDVKPFLRLSSLINKEIREQASDLALFLGYEQAYVTLPP